eukprot:2422601-Ditylum_brightwellii.AAC.1
MGLLEGVTDSFGLVGLMGLSMRKKCPPALLRALGVLRVRIAIVQELDNCYCRLTCGMFLFGGNGI